MSGAQKTQLKVYQLNLIHYFVGPNPCYGAAKIVSFSERVCEKSTKRRNNKTRIPEQRSNQLRNYLLKEFISSFSALLSNVFAHFTKYSLLIAINLIIVLLSFV